jgi:hypothetical protein
MQRLYNVEQALNLDYKSCEMIADELYNVIITNYPDREVWIEVSEDGENGCFNKYSKI